MNKADIITQPKVKYLINKWNKRINLSESVSGQKMSLEKKAALAVTLENTNQRLLAEATQSSDIGQYKRFALDMVTAVIPNLIAHDVCSVQPIDNRVGMINYVRYTYGSSKGKTTTGQEFASALNLGISDPNYTNSTVDAETIGNSGQTTYSGNLSWTPVTPGSVAIEVNGGTIVITDDQSGNLIAASGLTGSANTINYTTGAFSFTLSSASTQAPSASYSYNNEFVPAVNTPQIDLKIESLPVIAKSRKLRAVYGFDAAYELQKEYGQDIEALLASQAAAEIAYEIDIELTNEMRLMAGAGNEKTWSRTQPIGVNLIDHYNSFYAKLIEGSNMIYNATRKVRANFIVVGLNVASVVEVMSNFQPSGITSVAGPYFLGTLGQFKVYVTPNYDPNEYLLGYKGSGLFDAGYFYCPYMPIITTNMVMLDDFAARKGWATMYAKKMVNNKMYLRGRITD